MHAVVRLKSLLFHLAVPLLLGMLSSWLSGNAKEVYASLVLPSFAPPAPVYAVVWTVLYLLMGLSAYLVSTAQGISRTDRRSALAFYGILLLINFLWSFLFFRFGLLTFSAVWSLLLLGVTVLCAALFYRIRPAAGLLLVPVILWTGFATALNFSIAALN